MPNWCDNTLKITGKEAELKRFMAFGKSDTCVLDMNAFIPYPPEYKEKDKASNDWMDKADAFAKKHGCDQWWCGDKLTDELRTEFIATNGEQPKDGYNQGGYEWCIKHWGTKWSFVDTELQEDITRPKNKSITYNANTAWAPPLPLIIKMSELFPTLTFRIKYQEQGMGFSGSMKCKNGMILAEKHRG